MYRQTNSNSIKYNWPDIHSQNAAWNYNPSGVLTGRTNLTDYILPCSVSVRDDAVFNLHTNESIGQQLITNESNPARAEQARSSDIG